MAKHKSSRTDLMVMDARLASMNLFKASAYEKDKDPEFFLRALLPVGEAEAEKVRKAVIGLYKEAWPADAEVAYKKAKAANRVVLHNGDEQADKDGFDETVVYFNASSKDRPLIINRNRKPVAEEDGVFYPGCYANLKIQLYTWENAKGRGVGVDLVGVQFSKDGEQLATSGGGATASPDDFPDLGDEGEAGGDWGGDDAGSSDGGSSDDWM